MTKMIITYVSFDLTLNMLNLDMSCFENGLNPDQLAYQDPHRFHSACKSAHKYKYKQYSTSTDCFKYSFFSRTIPLWNRLPPAAAEAPSLVSFKRELSDLTF